MCWFSLVIKKCVYSVWHKTFKQYDGLAYVNKIACCEINWKKMYFNNFHAQGVLDITYF